MCSCGAKSHLRARKSHIIPKGTPRIYLCRRKQFAAGFKGARASVFAFLSLCAVVLRPVKPKSSNISSVLAIFCLHLFLRSLRGSSKLFRSLPSSFKNGQTARGIRTFYARCLGRGLETANLTKTLFFTAATGLGAPKREQCSRFWRREQWPPKTANEQSMLQGWQENCGRTGNQ